jgi:hypothetical protein
MTPRYEDIEVELVGTDGNAFSLIGKTTRALRRGGVEKPEIDEFTKAAMSGDYDNVLITIMQWVTVN